MQHCILTKNNQDTYLTIDKDFDKIVENFLFTATNCIGKHFETDFKSATYLNIHFYLS